MRNTPSHVSQNKVRFEPKHTTTGNAQRKTKQENDNEREFTDVQKGDKRFAAMLRGDCEGILHN